MALIASRCPGRGNRGVRPRPHPLLGGVLGGAGDAVQQGLAVRAPARLRPWSRRDARLDRHLAYLTREGEGVRTSAPIALSAEPAGREGEQSRGCYPDSEGFVERDGMNLFYEVYGEGEETIFLLPTWSLVHSR